MSGYASGTTVSKSRSVEQIEAMVERRGGGAFLHGSDRHRAIVQFELDGRVVRFVVPLPEDDDKRITHTPTGKRRADSVIRKAMDDELKRRYRSLCMCVKSKFVSIDDGVETFDEAFLPHLVMPGGRTFAETVCPQLPEMIERGEMPDMPMLPGGSL